jgi:hypothetical protein
MAAVVTSCVPINLTPTVTDDGLIRLEDGVVQVKDENGDWIPVAGTSTFQMVGELESADPWIAAGRTLETNDLTQIEEGLEPGDLVRVRGAILEDDTWVAYSIESAGEQTDPVIILIGIVDSVDPWVVNGIELTVTEETDIQGDIAPGTIVRVEILLLPDGTWQALSIALLGDLLETPGCVTVIATVLSVDGDQIQFEGWPVPVTLAPSESDENKDEEEDSDQGEDQDEEGDKDASDEEGGAETIQPGQKILAVVCINEDGQLVIVKFTLLDEDEDDGIGDGTGNQKVLVCHNASRNNPHTISIAEPAVPAHLAHGDTLGPCP